MAIINPERGSVGQADAHGGGRRGGRGRGGEVAFAEHPDPSSRRDSSGAFSEEDEKALLRTLFVERWGLI